MHRLLKHLKMSIKVSIFAFIFSSLLILCHSDDCFDQYGSLVETCPTKKDPTDFTACCWNNRTLQCCPSNDEYISDSLVMMISIIVILLCIILSILFVICCFWSPCPLYSVCRIKYTYGDIVAYSKAEEALNLPPETFEKNFYSPANIKVKNVEDQ